MAGSVADTSVLAALIFQEQRAAQAGSLLANVELFEPPLLFFELASVCRKKIHRYPERTSCFRRSTSVYPSKSNGST